MRSRRWLAAAALAATTASGAALSAAGAATPSAAPCGGATALGGNGWLTVKVPGIPRIADVRSVSYAPDRLYATDGRARLVRSDNGGCSWTDVSPQPPTIAGIAVTKGAAVVSALAAPSSATSAGYLYVGVDVTPTDALPLPLPGSPYIYVSSAAGAGYTVANAAQGLPAVGRVAELAASDLSPRVAYALITDAGSSSGVWATGDAGQSWSGPFTTETDLRGLRVDPQVPNRLYAVRPGSGLVVSGDGGRTFTLAGHQVPDLSSFGVSDGSGSLQLVEGSSSARIVALTVDAGITWRDIGLPEVARTVAVSPVLPVVVAHDDKALTIAQVDGDTAGIRLQKTPTGGPPRADSTEVSAPTPVGLAITGVTRDGSRILRSIYSPTTHSVVTPTLTPIHLLPQVTVRQFPATLSAATTTVRLPAGTSRNVDYHLLLPRTPSPVDLMFLVDTTDSTEQTIDGVRQGLQTVVNEMQSTGLNVQFGVADFKDYPWEDGGGGADGDYPYRLRRRIGPAGAALARALSALHAGGGSDVPESDLTALYESTLGRGELIGRHYVVRPGGEAGYRSGSLRLALLATDEPFHTEPDYPGPHWAETVAALNSRDVHQIGLAVQSSDGNGQPIPGTFNAVPDERRMAVATHALAPRGGVDCDGNGTTDIAAGQPLVCKIQKPADNRIKVPGVAGQSGVAIGSAPPPVHLAPLVVGLAESIPDYRAVALQVSGAPPAAAQTVSRPAAPVVNVRADNVLGYVVRYTCPRTAVGHTWRLSLSAVAGARALASLPTTLVCGAVAPKAPVPAALPPAAAITVAGGVAPPAPPNPPANVNTNVNPNPAVNPNAGFARQDEEQPQLALADADQGRSDETALAMSRRRSDDHAAWFVAAAGLLAAGAGAAAARSRAARVEYARVTRW